MSSSPGLISGGYIPEICPTLVHTFTSPEADLSSSFVKTHTASKWLAIPVYYFYPPPPCTCKNQGILKTFTSSQWPVKPVSRLPTSTLTGCGTIPKWLDIPILLIYFTYPPQVIKKTRLAIVKLKQTQTKTFVVVFTSYHTPGGSLFFLHKTAHAALLLLSPSLPSPPLSLSLTLLLRSLPLLSIVGNRSAA